MSATIGEEYQWWFQARPDIDSLHTSGLLDGDTFDFEADQGFNGSHRTRGRIVEIDSAETWFTKHDSDEYRTGMEQKRWAFDWLATASATHNGAWPLMIRTGEFRGARERWLVDIYRKSDGARFVDDFLAKWPAYTWPRTDHLTIESGGGDT